MTEIILFTITTILFTYNKNYIVYNANNIVYNISNIVVIVNNLFTTEYFLTILRFSWSIVVARYSHRLRDRSVGPDWK